MRVVPVDEYSEYKTPEVPKCQVSNTCVCVCVIQIVLQPNILFNFQLEFDMPSLKSLKALCDAMKNLSPTLTIYGCLGGELRFVVDTDSLMVSNRYINRNVQKTNYDGMPQIDGDEVACTVNAKQLAFHFISNQVSIVFYVFFLLYFLYLSLKLSKLLTQSMILSVPECRDVRRSAARRSI